MLLGLMVFVAAAARGRQGWAVAGAALAVWAKVAAAPVLALYLVVIARRRPLRALGLLLVAVAAGALLLAPFWRGPATLSAPAATVGLAGIRTSRSLADLVYWMLLPCGPRAQVWSYRLFEAACLLLVGALGVRALTRVRTIDDVIREALVLMLAYQLTAPWFQPWYGTWLLPLAVGLRPGRWTAVVAFYAGLLPLQYALPLDPVTSVAVNAAVLWRLRSAR
jgi:hypothetical protein